MAEMDVTTALKDWGAHNTMWTTYGPTTTMSEVDESLCEACRRGDVGGVKEALDRGAKPTVPFRLALGEVTPLFLCAQKGYKEIADLLIQAGAEVNKVMDFDRTTLLHHACSNDHPDMCSYFISKGSNVNAKDRLGRTPLMDAAEIGSEKAVEILLSNNCNVNDTDEEGFSALSYCIDFVNRREPNFYKTAKLLIKAGADANARGKFAERTILHVAAAQGDIEFVQQLVEQYDANIKVFDNEGKTPIRYAEANDHSDVHAYLTQQLQNQSTQCCLIL